MRLYQSLVYRPRILIGVILDVLFPWERNGWTKQNVIVCPSGVDSTTFTTQMSSQQDDFISTVKSYGCNSQWNSV